MQRSVRSIVARFVAFVSRLSALLVCGTCAALADDFDGDGRSDVLWQNTVTHELYLYIMNGSAIAGAAPITTVTSDWRIAGIGDFDGDSKTDILWQNYASGLVYLYRMNGATVTAAEPVTVVNDGWNVVGVGDFDADGRADVLWRNANTGLLYVYLMNGATVASAAPVTTITAEWRVAGMGDFGGDGRADILWLNTVSGLVYLYSMSGATITAAQPITVVGLEWDVAQVGDFDGNGRADILWFDATSGSAYLYSMNGAEIAQAAPVATVDAGWRIVDAGDYDSDGNEDILWRHDSGLLYEYAMDGAVVLSSAPVTTVAAEWRVVSSGDPFAAPQPARGGTPILLVTSSSNPFTGYLAEILRAEGLNAFDTAALGTITAAKLASYDVVVLGEVPLTAAQVTIFTNWVNAGGRLVAMRPDKKLAPLLGLTDASATLSNAYLRVNTSSPPGAGIVGETIQFHGTADLYSATSATTIAALYSSSTAATTRPAVTLRSVGAGQAAAFTYDLARSVVYTRQGNPAWSGQHRSIEIQQNNDTLINSESLFYGDAPFDPQPDWIDFSKIQIPQADEQQRLLANLVIQMNLPNRPLPRLWYLPSGFKAAIVMTGDDHAQAGTRGRWNHYIQRSTPNCSVADWECIRATSYAFFWTPMTDAQAQSFEAQGFEFALHLNTECADFASAAQLDSFYSEQLAWFADAFPSVAAPVTHRAHCVPWSDYDTQPKVEFANGIRLDTNYYYYPTLFVLDRPGLFTGSAMPMRFADRNGNLTDVYQATTQLTDESGQTYPLHIDTLLGNALGPRGYYGVFTANMHNDVVASADADAIIDSAQENGVPIVSARQMLTWLDGRNGSAFSAIGWDGGTLRFDLAVGAGARNLRAMLPIQVGPLGLATIRRGTTTVAFTTETIKGITYAIFPALAGSHSATYD
jgi:hypothetical protein